MEQNSIAADELLRQLRSVIMAFGLAPIIFIIALGCALWFDVRSAGGLIFALLFASIPLVSVLRKKNAILRVRQMGWMNYTIECLLVVAIAGAALFSVYGNWYTHWQMAAAYIFVLLAALLAGAMRYSRLKASAK